MRGVLCMDAWTVYSVQCTLYSVCGAVRRHVTVPFSVRYTRTMLRTVYYVVVRLRSTCKRVFIRLRTYVQCTYYVPIGTYLFGHTYIIIN